MKRDQKHTPQFDKHLKCYCCNGVLHTISSVSFSKFYCNYLVRFLGRKAGRNFNAPFCSCNYFAIDRVLLLTKDGGRR